MADEPDYGYSQVDWKQTNPENLKLVEAEYCQRLEASLNQWQDLEKKGQFILTGLIALVTAVLSLAFSQAKNLEPQYAAGLYALAVMFGFAAICAAVSVYPRSYRHVGVTPNSFNVVEWLDVLNGGDNEAREFSGMRIREYARGITEHGRSNAKKSRWLKFALIATVSAFPLSAAVFLFLNTTKAAVIAPVPACVP